MVWLALFMSWLPAWSVSFGAGGLALLGFGLLVYSLVPIVPYGRLATVGSVVAFAAACFLAGVGAAQAVSQEAEMRRQIVIEQQRAANLSRDLSAARAAQDAVRKAKEAAEIEAIAQKERADEYEADLEARPKSGMRLDADDVRSLRKLERRPRP